MKSGYIENYLHLFSKEECMRLEEKDKDFKRVSVKYDLLLKEKERMDTKLNGSYLDRIVIILLVISIEYSKLLN